MGGDEDAHPVFAVQGLILFLLVVGAHLGVLYCWLAFGPVAQMKGEDAYPGVQCIGDFEFTFIYSKLEYI